MACKLRKLFNFHVSRINFLTSSKLLTKATIAMKSWLKTQRETSPMDSYLTKISLIGVKPTQAFTFFINYRNLPPTSDLASPSLLNGKQRAACSQSLVLFIGNSFAFHPLFLPDKRKTIESRRGTFVIWNWIQMRGNYGLVSIFCAILPPTRLQSSARLAVHASRNTLEGLIDHLLVFDGNWVNFLQVMRVANELATQQCAKLKTSQIMDQHRCAHIALIGKAESSSSPFSITHLTSWVTFLVNIL